jgi:hypothetical protein
MEPQRKEELLAAGLVVMDTPGTSRSSRRARSRR